ncbi:MAG: ribosome small subunit-dependent GTPase A [Simkania sp.]|nr:ribosome small subunit-dependent GTPase A [Simkania sp.]
MKDHDQWDEAFYYQERKEHRKDRKIASFKDRSQFKKTDQDQKRKHQTSSEEGTEHLQEGRVLSIAPEGIIVDSSGNFYLCTLKGSLKQQNMRTKNLVAVGDFVLFQKETSQQKELTGTIIRIKERRSLLSRADNLSRRKEQLIAVNIDQVLITCSVFKPPLKPSLIDRYIIAAQKGHMQPVIVVNKIDLLMQDPDLLSVSEKAVLLKEKELYALFLDTYQSIHIPVLPVSAATGEGIQPLIDIMQNKASVFSGQSGAGKSSLINTITGSALRTGFLAQHTMKGSHTTTAASLLPIEGGGFCIDTPGIRSFGIWDLDREEIEAYFPEIFETGRQCRYVDCRHFQEPDCAVHKALEEGTISPLRFDSYCALMTDIATEHKHR